MVTSGDMSLVTTGSRVVEPHRSAARCRAGSGRVSRCSRLTGKHTGNVVFALGASSCRSRFEDGRLVTTGQVTESYRKCHHETFTTARVTSVTLVTSQVLAGCCEDGAEQAIQTASQNHRKRCRKRIALRVTLCVSLPSGWLVVVGAAKNALTDFRSANCLAGSSARIDRHLSP
jgi:hypothetical protein